MGCVRLACTRGREPACDKSDGSSSSLRAVRIPERTTGCDIVCWRTVQRERSASSSARLSASYKVAHDASEDGLGLNGEVEETRGGGKGEEAMTRARDEAMRCAIRRVAHTGQA